MKESPVPRLDLAPKLNRTLSLWNPFDYLLLLWWVLYFPQAIRWYVETKGGGEDFRKQKTWQDKIRFLRKHPVQSRLWIQGILLTVITPIFFCTLLERLGVSINWFDVVAGVVVSVVAGVVLGMTGTGGVVFGVAFGVALGVVAGVAFGVGGVAFGVAFGVAWGMAWSVAGSAIGMTAGIAFGAAWGVVVGALGVVVGMVSGVMVGTIAVVVGMVVDVAVDVMEIVRRGLAFGLTAGMTTVFFLLRPDIWLMSLFFRDRFFFRLLPRMACLPLSGLSSLIYLWLQRDWEAGIYNINQLLAYSLQFSPVLTAVNRALAEFPSCEIVDRVSHLAESPHDWKLLETVSKSLRPAPFSQDTPQCPTAAGFWYLHKKKADKAGEAFAVVRSLPYGEEMYTLAHTLHRFPLAEDLESIVSLESSPIPDEPRLRPLTWKAITSFNRVIEEFLLINGSSSQSVRSLALNRAIGELRDILDNQSETLPIAEKDLILKIARKWLEVSESIAGTVGNVTITRPVSNPYIIGDPVIGKRFVGRGDITREFESLWSGNTLQSVVLFGHRRMGKTSILRNLDSHLDPGIPVIYINLQRLVTVSELGEVLLAIADEIGRKLDISIPDEEKILQLPEITFNRYLSDLLTRILPEKQKRCLILALDEFEIIEELIEAGTLPRNFLGYLRSLVQMSPNLSFIFAGLHTLEEMTADYFNPFFGSVYPIPVTFLSGAATRVILANPAGEEEDFPLDYTSEALDKIYELTRGQPYLVQLVGFHLVRFYNNEVFEKQRPRDPRFTLADVENTIDAEFFQRGTYYFTGVWNQAGQGADGQQEILKILAPHRSGQTREEIQSLTALEEQTLEKALKTLEDHTVIEPAGDRWKISVELFRQWVETRHRD
ncbi:ATP-binding protein [Pannus brasiliensis CCIBt3594]|uniref:ATP-binding protein n=1 Tax=Pannus brasiliensis CCIBt3594 TaxID=1427578 RepID=A0AAW9QWE3_9CHRO